MKRPVIAQYHHNFIDRCETFIYNYVINLKRFYPIYLAMRFVNLDEFPLPENDLYPVPSRFPKKYTRQWLYYGIYRKCFRVDYSADEITLREKKVRLIHAHFGPQGCSALKLRGKLKIPVITTFYGYDVSRLPKEPEWIINYPILFREGDLFLVEGKFMKSKLVELGCPEKKIQIQRIAIPLDKIPFFTRHPKAKGEKVIILFSGRFVEKKGLLYALEAVKMVCGQNKNFEFRIIGDGLLRPQIEAFIKEHQLFDYVKLLGFLNYVEYLNEMGKADIFLHPSVTAEDGDSEGGAPTVILEAQATGMPVISTIHADIPNIVVPGTSALLSKERDVVGLADNIRFLLENQDKWETMGKVGHDFVEKYHDIRNEVNELENKYRILLSSMN